MPRLFRLDGHLFLGNPAVLPPVFVTGRKQLDTYAVYSNRTESNRIHPITIVTRLPNHHHTCVSVPDATDSRLGTLATESEGGPEEKAWGWIRWASGRGADGLGSGLGGAASNGDGNCSCSCRMLMGHVARGSLFLSLSCRSEKHCNYRAFPFPLLFRFDN